MLTTDKIRITGSAKIGSNTIPGAGGDSAKFLRGDNTWQTVITTPSPIRVNVYNPNPLFAVDPNICIWKEVNVGITIDSIEVTTSSASYEVAGDLKYADAFISKANPVVINDFDTTSGVRVDSSITSASVASGKCIYLTLDSAPNASMTQFNIVIYYHIT